MERIQSGDVRSLALLLDEAWEPLVIHLTGLLGSTEAAQDAAQEAFVRLWERRDRWDAGSARALLFRIGRNVALDVRRRREVRFRWRRERAMDPVASAPTPEEELERSEFHARFRSALESLPGRRREVFELVRFQDLSYREVGEVLGVTAQTVANQMSLALRDLRSLLRDELGGGEPGEEPGSDARSRNG